MEKLEAAVNLTPAASGTVEIALYTPAIEEVFRYKDGDISINKRLANGRNKVAESESLQAQLNNQQLTTQQQTEPQLEFDQSPTLDPNHQSNNNLIYLDKEFGYLSTDYYLRDASPIFGEWAKQFTPSGIYLMSQMGLDWQYFADKYSSQFAASQLALSPAPEQPQLPPLIEQHSIDSRAIAEAQTDTTISNQQLVETLAQMQQQIVDIHLQLEKIRQQQAERSDLVQPKDNRLSQWIDGIKESFTTTVLSIGEAVRGGIDHLKDTTKELVGAGLLASTKLAVETLGDCLEDGSKILTTGNIEYRLEGLELSAQPQHLDWVNLSLSERLDAIRTQYGITKPSPGERQQQQYQERSR